jgi:hypothetical protein
MTQAVEQINERSERKLFTVKQFCRPGQWPSESALRTLILDAAWGLNNFQSAFLRVNRRVLVDPLEFWKAVSRMQEDPNHACKR